ncbi:MAG: 50S ribosomal protein L5 [Candidatus Eisenbacteria bacterium]|jgi:large subunit ribosomal protein L5|uniref:Large ribosomal subunit protein uL5 n=1 Tax=Eiseniibacteriota bacterium TaxID=2212470 RepID=A0A538TRV1_UNCEI|nr:MAG: 50S ribosomal protein L5 [Candidatus Eisenbacteria bacterium]
MADEKEKKEKKEAKPKGEAKPKVPGADAKAKAKGEGKKSKGKGRDAGAAAGPTIAEAEPPARVPRIKEHYEKNVLPELVKRFSYKNPMQAPRLRKIVVNMGVGDALQNVKMLDTAAIELGAITGQKAALRRAKKSIANFKLREGQPIGCMVTLRGARMYEFYDRLVNVALPRIRDFRGVPMRSFDGRGNYTIGLTEQIIFPEINYDRVDKIRGMDVTFVTSAKTDEEGQELLRLLNMPFRQPQR